MATCYSFFFFNDTATTEIYTLSLHDALPIYYRTVVFAGITAYVSHHDINVLALETQHFGISGSQIVAVAVAIHGTKRGLHGLKTVGQFGGTDVPRMPYLVAIAQVDLVFFIPIGMRVADDSYLFHLRSGQIETFTDELFDEGHGAFQSQKT